MNEDTSLSCKSKTKDRFIASKTSHQAGLKAEISHDEFLNVLLENYEEAIKWAYTNTTT